MVSGVHPDIIRFIIALPSCFFKFYFNFGLIFFYFISICDCVRVCSFDPVSVVHADIIRFLLAFSSCFNSREEQKRNQYN